MSLDVVLTFAAVAILEIAIPLALGYVIVKKFGLKWAVFLYGALFFILSQAIHVPLLLLVQPAYIEWVKAVFPDQAMSLAALALFLGLFAGVLEEGIRYLVFSRFFQKKRLSLNREHGLLFGAGWGGIECIFVAFLVITTMISYIAVTYGVLDTLLVNATGGDPAQLAALETVRNLTPLDILPGLLERVMTIILHIAFTMLVLLAVLRSQAVYLFAAIALHALLDVAAVYVGGMYGIWPAEAVIVVFGAIGLGVVYQTWNMLREVNAPVTSQSQE